MVIGGKRPRAGPTEAGGAGDGAAQAWGRAGCMLTGRVQQAPGSLNSCARCPVGPGPASSLHCCAAASNQR